MVVNGIYICSSSLVSLLAGLSHPPQQLGGYYQSDERQAQSTFRLFNQLLALLRAPFISTTQRLRGTNEEEWPTKPDWSDGGRRRNSLLSFTKKNNKKPPSIFSFFLNATTTSSLSWRLLQHSLALLFARLLASYPMNSCRARGRNVCDYNKTHPCVCVGVLSICFNRFDTNRIQVFFYLFFPR